LRQAYDYWQDQPGNVLVTLAPARPPGFPERQRPRQLAEQRFGFELARAARRRCHALAFKNWSQNTASTKKKFFVRIAVTSQKEASAFEGGTLGLHNFSDLFENLFKPNPWNGRKRSHGFPNKPGRETEKALSAQTVFPKGGTLMQALLSDPQSIPPRAARDAPTFLQMSCR